jgi:hypothetical protein
VGLLNHKVIVEAGHVGMSGRVVVIEVSTPGLVNPESRYYFPAIVLDNNQHATSLAASIAGLKQLRDVEKELYGPLRPGIEGGT